MHAADCGHYPHMAGMVLNGVPLIMSMIYVWSRNFPDQVSGFHYLS